MVSMFRPPWVGQRPAVFSVPPSACSASPPPPRQWAAVAFPKSLLGKKVAAGLFQKGPCEPGLAGTGRRCRRRWTCWGKECSGKRVSFPGPRAKSLQEKVGACWFPSWTPSRAAPLILGLAAKDRLLCSNRGHLLESTGGQRGRSRGFPRVCDGRGSAIPS